MSSDCKPIFGQCISILSGSFKHIGRIYKMMINETYDTQIRRNASRMFFWQIYFLFLIFPVHLIHFSLIVRLLSPT